MKTIATLLFAATALAATLQAQAAQPDNYAGAAIGARTHYGLECTSAVRCDRNSSGGGKIYFGKQLEKNFAAEVMVFRLGRADGALKNGSSTVAGSARASGLAATGVFTAPLGDFSLKGRLGLGYVRGEADYAAGGGTAKNAFVPVVGIGASYALNQQVSLNADWDRLPAKFGNGNKATTSLLSVGVSLRF